MAKAAEAIASVDKEVAREEGLEVEGLIPSAGIAAMVEEVVANAYVDGKDGKRELGTRRQTGIKAIAEGLFEEERVLLRASGIVGVEIVAFVVLDVERPSQKQPTA